MSDFTGAQWQAIFRGKKALNGKPYSVTFKGDVQAVTEGDSIYDVLAELVDHMAEENAEMELPDGVQITLVAKRR